MSILGQTQIDPIGKILETGYLRFQSPTGLAGLAKRNGDRLDILAVHSSKEGRGQFREFILKAKSEFKTICVWEIWNPILESALSRYGFAAETEITAWGEAVKGMRWDAKPAS